MSSAAASSTATTANPAFTNTETAAAAAASTSSINVERFAVHLAAHLLGVHTLRRHCRMSSGETDSSTNSRDSSSSSPFQLYWRSSSSTALAASDYTTNDGRRLVFVDATFDFGKRQRSGKEHCTNSSSITRGAGITVDEEEDSFHHRRCIWFRWGSLWRTTHKKDGDPNVDGRSSTTLSPPPPTTTIDDDDSSSDGIYCTTAYIESRDLEDHFAQASIDPTGTPVAVLAQSMASALVTQEQPTPTAPLKRHAKRRNNPHADSSSNNDTPINCKNSLPSVAVSPSSHVVPTVRLSYPDVEGSADLTVGGAATSEPISGPVWAMMQLQYAQEQPRSLSSVPLAGGPEGNTNGDIDLVDVSNPIACENKENTAAAAVEELCHWVMQEWKPKILMQQCQTALQPERHHRTTTNPAPIVAVETPTQTTIPTSAAESSNATPSPAAAIAPLLVSSPGLPPRRANLPPKRRGPGHGTSRIVPRATKKRKGLQFASTDS